MKYFVRKKYNLKKYCKDVWYNRSIHMDNVKHPIVFEGIKYIDCVKGLIVEMGKTNNGKTIYYEVVKIRHQRGGDWLYPSDAIQCDLKFAYVK